MAVHSPMPELPTLPGRVESRGEAADGSPAAIVEVGRVADAASARRRSANGSYLTREPSVDLEDADVILGDQWSKRCEPRAARRRAESPVQLTSVQRTGRSRPRKVEFQEVEVSMGHKTVDSAGGGHRGNQDGDHHSDTKIDAEFVPSLPPRYRLRDLIQGDYAFKDDGER